MARSWRFLQTTVAVVALACAVPAQTSPQAPPTRSGNGGRVATSPTAPGTPTRAVPSISGDTAPPIAQNSVRFAVIGDTGTGERPQYETGEMLARSRGLFPFEFVIMVGDNLYGSERPQDFVRKFEAPYKLLIDAKVPFYAALGNHDDPNQRFYKPFNMNGERYYTFKKGNVRFFALDSNYMDRDQLTWLEKELSSSGSDWKVPFFHHPLYSSGGTHGSEIDLRTQIEPMFLKYGVNVVFTGHDHFYERIKPQRGIQHFVVGGAAKLRTGDLKKTDLTAVGFDTDTTYVLVEIAADSMTFQTLTRGGRRIDSGAVSRLALNQTDKR